MDKPLPLIYGVPHKNFYKDFRPTMAFVAELRPGLEGTKVVAGELLRHGVQPVVICDNMMAHCMERGLVNGVHIFYDRLTKKKAVCRTGSLIAVLCAFKRQIPVRLGRGRAGRRRGSLLKIDGRKVTAQNIKTFVPAAEDVPLIYVKG
ncbi:MAG: hypothetical protein ACM3L6_00220 [Deltaproteobacteria bacterium]